MKRKDPINVGELFPGNPWFWSPYLLNCRPCVSLSRVRVEQIQQSGRPRINTAELKRVLSLPTHKFLAQLPINRRFPIRLLRGAK